LIGVIVGVVKRVLQNIPANLHTIAINRLSRIGNDNIGSIVADAENEPKCFL
jgi:hypothetical protein